MRLSLLAILVCVSFASGTIACTGPEASTDDSAGTEAEFQASTDVFDSSAALAVTIRAPFAQLFARLNDGRADPSEEGSVEQEFSEPGSLVLEEGGTKKTIDLRVHIRGQSSRFDCPFPKLKVDFSDKSQLVGTPFAGHGKLRLNTHCGPGDVDTKSSMGRVMNGVGPVREDLTYRIVAALGIPTYRSRVLAVRYDDTAERTHFDTFAVALESHGDATKRFASADPPILPEGAKNVSGEDTSTLSITDENVAQILVAEAFAGNIDWWIPGVEGWGPPKPFFHNLESYVVPGSTKGYHVPVDFDLGAITQGADPKYRKVTATVSQAREGLTNESIAATVRSNKKKAEAAYLEAERSAIAAGAIPSDDGETTTDPGFLDAKARLDELFALPELTE